MGGNEFFISFAKGYNEMILKKSLVGWCGSSGCASALDLKKVWTQSWPTIFTYPTPTKTVFLTSLIMLAAPNFSKLIQN